MTFTNTEQIREKFIKDGWSENTSFEEITLKGKKHFRMNISGNVYDDKGNIFYFNIPCKVSTN